MSSDDLPLGWSAHVAPTGHTYYYHAETKKSTYTKPAADPSVVASPFEETEQVQDMARRSDRKAHGESALLEGTMTPEPSSYNDHPRYKLSIPNAEPWLQVETKQGYFFYHNTVTLESLWEPPSTLESALRDWQEDAKKEYEDEDIVSGTEEQYSDIAEDELSREVQIAPADEYGEDDIAEQLAAMQEAGETAYEPDLYDQGPELTGEEKAEVFRGMLLDHEVDPFRTWDSQVSKFSSDPRYLIFDTTHHRKAVFESFCAEQAHRIKQEKAAIVKEDPKVIFLRLLNARVKPGQYFVDFKRKHKKDSDYKIYGYSDNEREKLFRAFQEQNKLTRAEKERNLLQLLATQKSNIEHDIRYHVLDPEHAATLLKTHQGIDTR